MTGATTQETSTEREWDHSAGAEAERDIFAGTPLNWPAIFGFPYHVDASRSDLSEALRRELDARTIFTASGRSGGAQFHRFRIRLGGYLENSTGLSHLEHLAPILSNASHAVFVGPVSRPDDGSEIELLPATPTTGRPDVDARLLLWRVRTLDAAIQVARSNISAEVADRLVELRNQPRDVSAGEEPLTLNTVQWFLDYYLRREKEERPLIGMTPDGLVEVHWQQDRDRQLTIRFFVDGTVWIAIRDGSSRGSWEMLARDLLTDRSLVRIPDWA